MENTNDKQNCSRPEGIQLSWTRWVIISIVILQNFTLYCNMFSFASVQKEIALLFKVDVTQVNWLANMFSATYVPSTFIATFLFQSRGARYTLVLSIVLISVGCWIRFLSYTESNPNFGFLLVGQFFISLSQAMCLLSPVRVATDWFGAHEQSLANNAGIYAGSIGSAAGLVIPALFFSEHTIFDVHTYTLYQAVFSTALVLFTYACYTENPPQPPSHVPRRILLVSPRQSSGQISSVRNSTESHFKLLINTSQLLLHKWVHLVVSNPDFRFLCFANMILTGVLLSFLTCISEYLKMYSYLESDAGMAGSIIIFMGFVTAMLSSFVTDRWHNYNSFIKWMSCTVFVTTTLFVLLLPSNNTLLMVILVGIPFGLNNALGCHLIELAVEYTYPLSEDVSSGLITIFGSLGGLLFTVLLGKLLLLKPLGPALLANPGGMFLIFATSVGFILTLLCNGKYQRHLTAQRSTVKAKETFKEHSLLIESHEV